MGNENDKRKDAFGMNIELIGTNLTQYKNLISKAKSSNSIQNYWKFHYESNKNVYEQINKMNLLILGQTKIPFQNAFNNKCSFYYLLSNLR